VKNQVVVNGCEFEVWQEGSGAKTPVILIHGEGHGLDYFEYVVPHLAKDRHVVAFSRRGHGRSACPDWGWSVYLQARDVAGILDATGIDGPADVLGVAFGTTVASEFALSFPERTRSLAMVAWSEIEGVESYIALFEKQTPGVLGALESGGREGLKEYVLAGAREWSPVWPARAEHRQVYSDWLSNRPAGAWLGRLEFVSSVPRYVDRLAATKIPILGIEGGNDPFPCDPSTLAGNPNFVQTYIEGADRFIHWEHPVEFHALLDEFYDRVESMADTAAQG